MLIPNQIVEIKIHSSNIKHFKTLKYDCKIGDIMNIPVEHLMNGSNVYVNVKCDYCSEIIPKKYAWYIISKQKGLDCCKSCKNKKYKEAIIKKYGVENVSQLKETQDKIKSTYLSKYGVEHYSQSEEGKDKYVNTCLTKYGVDNIAKLAKSKEKTKQTNINRYGVEYVLASTKIKEKGITTCLEKYGVKNFSQCDEYKEKTINTSRLKYGCEHFAQSPLVKEKRNKTLTKNGNVPTSSQQIELHKMIQKQYQNAILNYPCSRCIFDIALIMSEEIKIDIEYDGSFWHKDQQKDRRRDEYFKSQGWKILRIKSGHKLPSTNELLESIDYLINTNHHFKEIILDDWVSKTA